MTEASKYTLINKLIPPIFVLFSYGYVVGTSNNYFDGIGAAAVFIVAAVAYYLVKFDGSLGSRSLAHMSVLSLLFSFLVVQTGSSNPYRQPVPLSTMDSVVDFKRFSGLKVSKEMADYLNKLSYVAAKNGFADGQFLIDMTGASPGALYAMGARSPGAAWHIGGYQGSDAKAIRAFAEIPPDRLSSAWILTEPGSSRALGVAVLDAFNIDLTMSYTLVAELDFPIGLGGRRHPIKQRLYRPIREQNGES